MSRTTDVNEFSELEEFSYLSFEYLWITDAVNVRMDNNCGGGGQRLPPDGDEFPAAYQEFTNCPSQQYQYVTTRETMAANGDVDRGDATTATTSNSSTNFIPTDKVAKSRSIFDKKDMTDFIQKELESDSNNVSGIIGKRSVVSNYVLYGSQQKSHVTEKKIEIAGYYSKDSNGIQEMDKEDAEGSPPPLPLTGPPKIDPTRGSQSQSQQSAMSGGDLWRQDNKSEKSVKDKIAMFSSQSSLEAPLFPAPIVAAAAVVSTSGSSTPIGGGSPRHRLSKHKSSDNVFADDKKPLAAERTQSSFDLSVGKKTPSLPRSSPPSSPGGPNGSSSNNSSKSSSPLNSYSTAYNGSPSHHSKSFDASCIAAPATPKSPSSSALLTRATSFSGSLSGPYCTTDKLLQSSGELTSATSIARTSSLASTFKRPMATSSDEMRKSSLSQLIEQRRKGISKLRGLVIPEKDALAIDQPIIDLPEIKSRESILVNNQVSRANSNIHDKWGSQSSLASNASTVSSSIRTNNTSFKMPAPKILSSYSPAFKRKSLSVYGNHNGSNGTATQSNNSSSLMNGNAKTSSNNNGNGTTTNQQLSSPASDAPKSLESICSPTRSDYSFDFVSSSGSPENNHPASNNKPSSKFNCQRKIGRNEYDDSDNDSAVSSSQSSISRGFSPPTSPVPSDRSTISSERSYLSSETHYHQRPQLILDSKQSDKQQLYARSYSVPEKTSHLRTTNQQQQQPSSHIPQRQQQQILKRSISTDTNSSSSTTNTLTSQASTESLSRRVLKPQSVEAINRKNILASARCRSGRDLNGSPLIQRKFADDEEEEAAAAAAAAENGDFVSAHRVTNGNGVDGSCVKPEIKVAYIEITESVIAVDDGEKVEEEEVEEQRQVPRLPPKRSVIPQAKSAPIPTSRPPKPEPIEPSNDIKSWVRSEMRNLAANNSNGNNSFNSYETRKNKTSTYDAEIPSPRNFRSKSSLTLNEQSPSTGMGSRSQSIDGEGDDLIDSIKPRSRSNFALKKATDNDLITVLTTKSRSRSAIHVEDNSGIGSYGKLKSQMSLEDILATKNSEPTTKLPRSLSVTSDSRSTEKITETSIYTSETFRSRRSNLNDTWSDDKSPFLSSKLGGRVAMNMDESIGESNKSNGCSKIPMARNLGRRSASVTDMKKVFEKVDHVPIGNNHNTSLSSGGQSVIPSSSSSHHHHNRFPSLDSSVEESVIRPSVSISSSGGGSNNSSNCEPDPERFSGEQFGSISSLASSTSLISQQELAQLVEEANLEEPRGGHDVAVVLLHKENPAGSVGIILAGGLDCETKEITIHRVLTHSIADKEGSVQRGDRILSINGRSMRGLTHRESLAVLKQPRSEVVLVVSRAKAEDCERKSSEDSVKLPAPRLRTRFESAGVDEGTKTTSITTTTSANCTTDNTAWGPPLVVAMYKDGTGLGFSLEGGHDSPLGDRPLLIKKIFTGGAAEKTGALRAGDQLLEVNNRDVSRMSRIEAWSLMKKLPDGEVSLLVRHPATKSTTTTTTTSSSSPS